MFAINLVNQDENAKYDSNLSEFQGKFLLKSSSSAKPEFNSSSWNLQADIQIVKKRGTKPKCPRKQPIQHPLLHQQWIWSYFSDM